jgi:adenine phosphoribosyltransferase
VTEPGAAAAGPSPLATVVGLLREVPDFPGPGIRFWDLTPVLADAAGLGAVTDLLSAPVREDRIDVVVGIEARGFLLGAPVAHALGRGVVPVRKEGKLPAVGASEAYDLEYGSATLEVPEGLIAPGTRVWLIDDVLATGGTAAAACALLERVGAVVAGLSVVLELPALAGRDRLAGRRVHALLER